jgi:hypothetical protein
MSPRILAALVSSALLLALPGPAAAGELLDFSIGAKGGGGGDVWLTPESVPAWAGSQDFFTTTRGGWSYGGGVFAELRVLKYLGLEVDFLFFAHTIKQDTTRRVGGVAVLETEERFEWTSLRIPILVKGVLPLGMVRLWLGLGPEIAVPLTASASLDKAIQAEFHTRTGTDVYLATALGLVIEVGPIGIPIDLRFSWNATQPRKYDDLVQVELDQNVVRAVTVRASNTVDARLLIGVAYEF